MAERNEEEILKSETSHLDYKTQRIKYWTAVVVLASTLIPTLAVIFSYQQIKSLIAQIAEKPLEGTWVYSSRYEKYYDEPQPQDLYGKGRAIIVWKYRENRYDVNLSYSVTRLENKNPILTVVFQGPLAADATGWPAQQPFVMDNFQVLDRLHYQNKAYALSTYQFRDCNYIKNGDRPDKIMCVLETPHSRSNVEFHWQSNLH